MQLLFSLALGSRPVAKSLRYPPPPSPPSSKAGPGPCAAGLGEPLELLLTGEVPVGSLDALCDAHDVVVVAVRARAHHILQHELQVVGRGGVADEEEARAVVHVPVRHRLTHDLKRLLLTKIFACKTEVIFGYRSINIRKKKIKKKILLIFLAHNLSRFLLIKSQKIICQVEKTHISR